MKSILDVDTIVNLDASSAKFGYKNQVRWEQTSWRGWLRGYVRSRCVHFLFYSYPVVVKAHLLT